MSFHPNNEMPVRHVPELDAVSRQDSARRAEQAFAEFRRKVQDSELLSRALEKLLLEARFNGRLTVLVQNGRVLKSGYEEGYFHHKEDERRWT